MILQALIKTVKKNKSSTGMAVPKKRRSKAKGKTRLSNWKRKGEKVAIKAYNAAKTFFAQEKKAAASSANKEPLIDSSNSENKIND